MIRLRPLKDGLPTELQRRGYKKSSDHLTHQVLERRTIEQSRRENEECVEPASEEQRKTSLYQNQIEAIAMCLNLSCNGEPSALGGNTGPW